MVDSLLFKNIVGKCESQILVFKEVQNSYRIVCKLDKTTKSTIHENKMFPQSKKNDIQ